MKISIASASDTVKELRDAINNSYIRDAEMTDKQKELENQFVNVNVEIERLGKELQNTGKLLRAAQKRRLEYLEKMMVEKYGEIGK